MGKRNIAFVISSLDYGGAQRALANITRSLPDCWDIDVILNNDNNIVYPCKKDVRIISLNIKNTRNRTGLIYQIIVFIRRFFFLLRVKKSKQYDVVVSFLDSANVVNILSGNKFCKCVISERVVLSSVEGWKYRLIVRLLAKYFYNRADTIVACSNDVRDDLINNYHINSEKVLTIYNGCDYKGIKKSGTQDTNFQIDKSKTNFVTVGRLSKQKGQWHLLRVFGKIYKYNKKARLYILGEGELYAQLLELASDLSIEEAVVFCGFVDNPYALLSKMDIFVSTSLYEGFSNALLEAMACGLPCVSTDHIGGAREILCERYDKEHKVDSIEYAKYGVLIPNMSEVFVEGDNELDMSENELYKCMSSFCTDMSLRERYSKASEERIKSFSMESVCEEWIKVLSQ